MANTAFQTTTTITSNGTSTFYFTMPSGTINSILTIKLNTSNSSGYLNYYGFDGGLVNVVSQFNAPYNDYRTIVYPIYGLELSNKTLYFYNYSIDYCTIYAICMY